MTRGWFKKSELADRMCICNTAHAMVSQIPWSGLRPDTPPATHDYVINYVIVHRFDSSREQIFFLLKTAKNRVTPHALYNAVPEALPCLASGGIPPNVQMCIPNHFKLPLNPSTQRPQACIQAWYTYFPVFLALYLTG